MSSFDLNDTDRVSDNDLANIELGLVIAHPTDLVKHIQFLRNKAEEVDPGTLKTFVQNVDAADNERRAALDNNANLQRELGKLSQIATGGALDIVMKMQSLLHRQEDAIHSAGVDIPNTLCDMIEGDD